jgi:hypothetical protein
VAKRKIKVISLRANPRIARRSRKTRVNLKRRKIIRVVIVMNIPVMKMVESAVMRDLPIRG